MYSEEIVDNKSIVLSNHARKRQKKRLGISKNNNRLAIKAKTFEFTIEKMTGKLLKYILSVGNSYNNNTKVYMYGQFLYYFDIDSDTLVTVYGLPNEYMKTALKQQKQYKERVLTAC